MKHTVKTYYVRGKKDGEYVTVRCIDRELVAMRLRKCGYTDIKTYDGEDIPASEAHKISNTPFNY